VLRESGTETWDTKAFWESIFISMPAAAQQIHIKCWALRTKGSHLIYPCKQVTEAKSKV
jgi:hypothetical protein